MRPVHTLWSRVFLDPVSAWLAARIATFTLVTPMRMTLVSFALGLTAAGLFLRGDGVSLVAGAVVFQLSSVADGLDGLIARMRPGSGSVLGLVADHVLDSWRVILSVLALAYGQYLITGGVSVLLWAAAFLGVHFVERALPITISKVRGAYRSLYEPRFSGVDGYLMRLKDAFARRRLKVVLYGTHEREMVALLIGPALGLVEPGLIAATALALPFYLLRLRFDVALIKSELVQGSHEYLGDSANPWEAGAVSRRSADG